MYRILTANTEWKSSRLLSNGNQYLSLGQGGQGVKLNAHLSLVPRIKMRGCKRPLSYDVMAWSLTKIEMALNFALIGEQKT